MRVADIVEVHRLDGDIQIGLAKYIGDCSNCSSISLRHPHELWRVAKDSDLIIGAVKEVIPLREIHTDAEDTTTVEKISDLIVMRD